jgi:hypothetical protein
VTLSPSSLTFSNQAVGTTSGPQVVTLTNTGSATLTISSIAANGDFAPISACTASLGAGSACTVSVAFTPTAGGTRTGTLTFTDSASGSPQTVSLTGTGLAANSVPVSVNSGPANSALNVAYVSVQVCNPGSTTSCATIPNVQVDTGSSGLRILASALGSGVNLTPVTGGGAPVDECIQFGDGSYLWGPVVQADVSLAGEKAASLPIQIIASGATPIGVPSTCAAGGGSNLGTTAALQANGILGIGTAIQDCGSSCTGTTVLPYYWLCPSGGCSLASVPTATQVSNPVSFFASDNNGVILTMNSVGSSGAATATGTLTFGIGTQTDNALGSANVYGLGLWASGAYAGAYTLQSTYNGVAYPAFIDTASPFTYFLDPTTIGVPGCSGTYAGLYCPSSTTSFTVSNMGYQGTAANASISVGNAQTLLSNASLSAFSNLAGISGTGVSNDFVEFGLPFFYGRTVYVGIVGKVAPSGVPASAVATGYYAF